MISAPTGPARRAACALAALAMLAGCDSSAAMQHTNSSTNDQLNEIADNTSADAGNARTIDPNDPAQAAQAMGAGVATKPRKY